MNNTQNLGNLIRQQRIRIGLTLLALAAKSGVSLTHFSRIEQAQRYPSANALRKIAKPLGIEEKELFTLASWLPTIGASRVTRPGEAQAASRT